MSENAILFAALLSTFVYIASALGRLECFIRKRDPAIPFILYSILQLLTAPIALVFWYFFMKH